MNSLKFFIIPFRGATDIYKLILKQPTFFLFIPLSEVILNFFFSAKFERGFEILPDDFNLYTFAEFIYRGTFPLFIFSQLLLLPFLLLEASFDKFLDKTELKLFGASPKNNGIKNSSISCSLGFSMLITRLVLL